MGLLWPTPIRVCRLLILASFAFPEISLGGEVVFDARLLVPIDDVNRILPADVDGDGDPDVAIHSGQDFVGWCEQNEGPTVYPLPCSTVASFMGNPHPAMFTGKFSPLLDPDQDTIMFWEDFGAADFWLCYDDPGPASGCGLITDSEHAAIFDRISQSFVARLTPLGAAPEQLLYYYPPNGFDAFGWDSIPLAPKNHSNLPRPPLYTRSTGSGLLLDIPFAADLDGDGNDDVVLQNLVNALPDDFFSISWLKITDLASVPPTQITEYLAYRFPENIGLNQESVQFRLISAGDVNSDEHIDLLVSRVFAASTGLPRRLIWLENDGTFPPSFVENEIATFSRLLQVEAGDLDRDGDTDVVVMTDNFGLLNVRFGWYENLDGDGKQWAPLAYVVDSNTGLAIDDVDASMRFHLVDYGRDGDLDILDVGTADPIASGDFPTLGVRVIQNVPEPQPISQILAALVTLCLVAFGSGRWQSSADVPAGRPLSTWSVGRRERRRCGTRR